MNEASTATEPAAGPSDEAWLEVIAEVELLRRKSTLIEARLSRWEARLEEACAVVDGLLAARDPGRDPEARLSDLEARVERLVRRRGPPLPEAPAPVVEPAPVAPAPPAAPPPAAGSVAIVRARWLLDGEPVSGPLDGATAVELVADVDGVPAGEAVRVEVRPLGSPTAAAVLDALSDGLTVRARWTPPADSDDRAWCFVARAGRAESTSAPLYLAG